jgi:hypothetical protein
LNVFQFLAQKSFKTVWNKNALGGIYTSDGKTASSHAISLVKQGKENEKTLGIQYLQMGPILLGLISCAIMPRGGSMGPGHVLKLLFSEKSRNC